jgi:hypothetical protein
VGCGHVDVLKKEWVSIVGSSFVIVLLDQYIAPFFYFLKPASLYCIVLKSLIIVGYYLIKSASKKFPLAQ